METIKETYASFYRVDPSHVFVLPGRGTAAYLAFQTLIAENFCFSNWAVPINRNEVMDGVIRHFKLPIIECDLSLRDFGLDPDSLDEIGGPANCLYIENAHGVASSYILKSHGRFTIEDSMNSPFVPNTGTGDIIYTSIPGNLARDFSVLIFKDDKYIPSLAKLISQLNLQLHSSSLQQLERIINNRTEILYMQILSAHLLLKLLDNRIQTANILCHHFTQIPLILPCDACNLFSSQNLGYSLSPLLDYSVKSDVHPNAHKINNRSVKIEFYGEESLSLQLISGIADRINSYIDSILGDA